MKTSFFSWIEKVLSQEDVKDEILNSNFREKLSNRIFGYSVNISFILCLLIFAFQLYKVSVVSENLKISTELKDEITGQYLWIVYPAAEVLKILGLGEVFWAVSSDLHILITFIIDWLILLFLLWSILSIYYYNKPKKYLLCPYCKKSVKVFTNWQCDSCLNFQGEERYITKKCKECGEKLDTVFCEHCGREFKL